jgi:hypothetical protein
LLDQNLIFTINLNKSAVAAVVDEQEVVVEIDDHGMSPGNDFIVINKSILRLAAEADAAMDFIDDNALVAEIQFEFGLQDTGDRKGEGFGTKPTAKKWG